MRQIHAIEDRIQATIARDAGVIRAAVWAKERDFSRLVTKVQPMKEEKSFIPDRMLQGFGLTHESKRTEDANG